MGAVDTNVKIMRRDGERGTTVEYHCDGCDEILEGRRVVFTSEATDESGVDVEVAKRWTVCPSCADEVFERIDEPSPWSDEDFKTLVLPEEEAASQHTGGFMGRID